MGLIRHGANLAEVHSGRRSSVAWQISIHKVHRFDPSGRSGSAGEHRAFVVYVMGHYEKIVR